MDRDRAERSGGGGGGSGGGGISGGGCSDYSFIYISQV